MDTRPIGIFDSGVGGTTVFNEIIRKMPNENTIYIGDTKHFPYGDKDKEEVLQYAKQITDFLIAKNVKAIIIACNTATSYAAEYLRKQYNIPIIGTILPTMEYIKKEEKLKKVGVIATEGTIKKNAWKEAIQKTCDRKIEVLNKACPLFATVVENGDVHNEKTKQIIRSYMEIFKKNKIDGLILGCTHYPAYEELLKDELGYPITIINPASKISNTLYETLKKKNLLNEGKDTFHDCYITDMTKKEKFAEVANQLLNCQIELKVEEIKEMKVEEEK
ncbi:MAG: glutamate racemase [Clostridia bacterium]